MPQLKVYCVFQWWRVVAACWGTSRCRSTFVSRLGTTGAAAAGEGLPAVPDGSPGEEEEWGDAEPQDITNCRAAGLSLGCK